MLKRFGPVRALVRNWAGLSSALSFALSLVLIGIALAGADENAAALSGAQVRAHETYGRVFTYPASIFLLFGLAALVAAMCFLVQCEVHGKPSKSRRYS